MATDAPHDEAACPLGRAASRFTSGARAVAPTLAVLVLVYIGVWLLLVEVGLLGWRRQVDRLSDPASVTAWTASGVVLANGRDVPLPGIRKIMGPAASLERITRGGAEVNTDGRLFVLVRIYSGCGNCTSFAERRLKYDLSALLVFLELAEPDASIPRARGWGSFARRRLDEAGDWEWGLTMLGGDVGALDDLYERSGIPLAPHAAPGIAFPW